MTCSMLSVLTFCLQFAGLFICMHYFIDACPSCTRWRLVLQFKNDPLHNGSLKEMMDHKEDKILARARLLIHMWQKQKYVAAIVHFLRELRDDRQDLVYAIRAKFVAIRKIQRCVRAFVLSRKTSWMVWEMQWIRFERSRNRELMKKWKSAWKQTMATVAQVVKVVPGKKGSSKTKQSHHSTKWVGHVMDDFIANLPEEVKNIIDVPADVRRFLLARHKVRLVDELILRIDDRKRRVKQMRTNRTLRDELCQSFPHLGEMDISSQELQFLQDVDHEPPHPHLPLALKKDDLSEMLLYAQKIARGKELRPDSPPEAVVLKAIPHNLEHIKLNGISLDDSTNQSEVSRTVHVKTSL